MRMTTSRTGALLLVALAAWGCGSSAGLKPDGGSGKGGSDAGAGSTGAAGSATGTAGASGSGGASVTGVGGTTGGAGVTGGGGTTGGGGAGGTLGYCDKDEDCVFHSVCCGGTCDAKTDPAAKPQVCATSCAVSLGPSTCGCVNHKCSADSACIVTGSGLCPYCPFGYQTGATGCATCICAAGDGGTDGPLHARGDSCDDGVGCESGLVCKAIGDPCPTYPKCKQCYLPCGNGGSCPTAERCFPPVGQGGNVCL
jgi:hypothetical protein